MTLFNLKKIQWTARHAGICRDCFNKNMAASLESEDFLYWKNLKRCQQCGAERHIVAKVTFKGLMKLWLPK